MELLNFTKPTTPEIAKDYKIFSEGFLEQYSDFPEHMNALGKFVYLRTYSRFLMEEKRRETWKETVKRAVHYNLMMELEHCARRNIAITKQRRERMKKEAVDLFEAMYNLDQFLAGRTLWAGDVNNKKLKEIGLSQFNCSHIIADEWKTLAEVFYALMAGTGAGITCRLEHAAKLKPIRAYGYTVTHKPYEFVGADGLLEDTMLNIIGDKAQIVIGDSKVGWVNSLLTLLNLLTDSQYDNITEIEFIYDYVRPHGRPLKGFGGTASGPEPLQAMFEGIIKTLRNELDKSLAPLERVGDLYVIVRPIHILDMCNLIGYNVVVGGVRRTAEIFLFSPEDYEVVFAKFGINGIWGDDKFEYLKELRQDIIKNGMEVPGFFDELEVKYYYVYDVEDNRKMIENLIEAKDRKKLAEFTDPEEAAAFALANGYKPAVGNPEDEDYIPAEYYPFPCNEKRPLHHRRMSNNSVGFIEKPSKNYVMLLSKMQKLEGEPGMINLYEAARRFLKSMGVDHPDHETIVAVAKTLGLNPCAEIILTSRGVCNLTTINVKNFVIKSGRGYVLDIEGLIQAQRRSARAGLRMTLVELELPGWDEQLKNYRLTGCSLTGWQDAMAMVKMSLKSQEKLLKRLRNAGHDSVRQYAAELRIQCPLFVTAVKPEGTLSQVAGGVSSGLHFSHSPYFIRRIRISSSDPLALAVKESGWRVNPETGTPGKDYYEKMENAKTLVVDFPMDSGSTISKEDVSALEQFEIYRMFQRSYTDMNTSNTITVKPDEWEELFMKIYNNWDEYVGVSFLALDGGSYELAPYETITKKEYEKLTSNFNPLRLDLLAKYDEELYSQDLDDTIEACDAGACGVR